MTNFIPMMAISALFSFEASAATSSMPGFEKGTVLHHTPALTSIVSTWDGAPRSCPKEHHTNFDVRSFINGEVVKVGEILVQVKGPGSYDYETLKIGTHVRIRSVDIKPEFQRRGFAKMALQTLITSYRIKGGFDRFKLEATDMEPHLKRLYTSLGFSTKGRLGGMGGDVEIYLLDRVVR